MKLCWLFGLGEVPRLCCQLHPGDLCSCSHKTANGRDSCLQIWKTPNCSQENSALNGSNSMYCARHRPLPIWSHLLMSWICCAFVAGAILNTFPRCSQWRCNFVRRHRVELGGCIYFSTIFFITNSLFSSSSLSTNSSSL